MVRRLVALVVVVVIVAFALADVWLFLVPHDQKAITADAVVVLSGSKDRLPVGVGLVRAGAARLLVISRNERPSPLEDRACSHAIGLQVLCLHVAPLSTQGEARLIATLAHASGWNAVDVVTSKFHAYRARFMIRRCYHGGLAVVGAPNPGGLDLVRDLVLEPVKLVYHELLRRGC